MTSTIHDPRQIATALEAEFDRRWPGVCEEIPLERHVAAIQNRSAHSSYHQLDVALVSWCETLKAGPGGSEALEHYHRIVLARLIDATGSAGPGLALPASIRKLVEAEQQRILRELLQPRRNFYVHGNDAFAKDLALASMRLIPCGSEHVDVRSGIPRSLALSGGVGQALDVVGVVLLNGGFRPWFESHWDRRLLAGFDSRNYELFYRRIVELFELYPTVRGLIGSSWWFDPAVAEISPELAFLTEVPLANGARRFRVGANETATRDALRFARVRSRLHAAGQYTPCVYMIAWGRQSMLDWARRSA